MDEQNEMSRSEASGEQGGRPPRVKRYDVTPEEFVRAWMQAETLDDVAQKLAMPKAIVAARASHYRSMGLPLKTLNRKRPSRRLDLERLKQIIADYEVQGETRKASKPPALEPDQVKDICDQVLRRQQ